jgi:hypothetical protein
MSSESKRIPPVRGTFPPRRVVGPLPSSVAPGASGRQPVIVRSSSRTGRKHRDDEKEQIVIEVQGLWAGPQRSRGNRSEPLDPLPMSPAAVAFTEARIPEVGENHALLAVQVALVVFFSMLALVAMLAMAFSV